jgi:hypothetical protein
VISGSTLKTTAAGTVKVTATIVNGASSSINFTKEFTIAVSLPAATKPIAWSGLAANGEAHKTDTTVLTLSFDVSPDTLTTDHVKLTGATKGILSGSGATLTLGVSDITVAEGESVTVTLENPSGYEITPLSKSVAVHKAASTDGRPDDDDETAANSSGVIDIPDFTPSYDDVETAVTATKFTSKTEIPADLRDVTVLKSGTVIADTREIERGLAANDAAELDLVDYGIIPLPVFEAEVSKRGNTSVVRLWPDMDEYDGVKAGDIVAVKLLPDGSAELLRRSTSLEGITDGQFILTNENGKKLSASAVIEEGERYGVVIAVADGGDYDWDGAKDGYVLDPAALAVRRLESSSSGGGAVKNTGLSSGGCDAGALGLAALLICSLALVSGKKRG